MTNFGSSKLFLELNSKAKTRFKCKTRLFGAKMAGCNAHLFRGTILNEFKLFFGRSKVIEVAPKVNSNLDFGNFLVEPQFRRLVRTHFSQMGWKIKNMLVFV